MLFVRFQLPEWSSAFNIKFGYGNQEKQNSDNVNILSSSQVAIS